MREKKVPTHQSHCVQDVDEEGQDLSVEVGREEGAEGGEEDHDGGADGQEPPALQLGPGVGHELAVEDACRDSRTDYISK